VLLGPSLDGPTLLPLLQLLIGYICVPHWCWVAAPISWNFISCGNHKTGPVMVVFTLSCCATWPFPPWTHLNFSLTIIDRLNLCSTLVLGGSTHYIPYLGTEKGGVTPSVCCSTSVSHTTRNLRHECRRFLIIDQCLSVTPPGIFGTFGAK
jgi:hypothetical protein